MVHACLYTVTAGSYVLGVLSAQESNEFQEHAEGRPYCQREVMELTAIARPARAGGCGRGR